MIMHSSVLGSGDKLHVTGVKYFLLTFWTVINENGIEIFFKK